MHTSGKLSGRPCTYMEDHTPIWKGFFLEPFPSYFHVTEPLARTEGFLDYIIFVLTVVRQTSQALSHNAWTDDQLQALPQNAWTTNSANGQLDFSSLFSLLLSHYVPY